MAKSSYRSKYCEEVIAYFTDILKDRDKEGKLKSLPSYVGFARKIGVTVRTIENWRNKFEKFSEACEECDAILQETLICEGMLFRAHASFVKFILSSRYGLRERVEISHDSELIDVPEELQELIKTRARRMQK